MKMSRVVIGDHCTVGSGSLVLYDATVEDGAVLGDLSLLMKGETLPSETRWAGIPARAEGPPGSLTLLHENSLPSQTSVH